MTTLSQESTFTGDLVHSKEDMALMQALTEGTDNAVVIDHLVKYFVKGQGFNPIAAIRGWFGQASPEKRDTIKAIDDCSITIKRREIVGVLGSNGSGKSTLIRAISTLVIPDSGTISIFGHDVIKEEQTVQRLINRVSVEASFFRKLSPMENLIYAARLYNLNVPEARARVKAILRRLGIKADRFNQPIENMSRGMQQKIAIARAFLTSPIVLLLDEPTTGLDPRSKLEVQAFISELRQEHNATILLTTHDMDEAEALCDRVAIIDAGKIIAIDTAAALKERAGHEMNLDGPASLHEVFMHYTGRSWQSDEIDEEGEE